MTINNSPVDVMQEKTWESVPWRSLQVGDIVRVSMLYESILIQFTNSLNNANHQIMIDDWYYFTATILTGSESNFVVGEAGRVLSS